MSFFKTLQALGAAVGLMPGLAAPAEAPKIEQPAPIVRSVEDALPKSREIAGQLAAAPVLQAPAVTAPAPKTLEQLQLDMKNADQVFEAAKAEYMAAAEAATKGLEPLKKKVEEAAEAAKAIQKALLEAQKQQAPTVAPTATAPQAATAVSPQMNEADMAKLVADMVAADPELAKLFGGAEATKPAAPTVTATNQTLAPTTTTANLGAAGPAGATNTVTAQPTTPAPAANPMAAIMELLGSAKA